MGTPEEGIPFAGMESPQEFVKAEFFLAPDILGGLAGEERRNAFRRYGEENRRRHANLIRSLNRLMPQCNPMHALAHFAYYDQLVLRGRSDNRYKPIEQHSIEFFQAYFLTFPVVELRVRHTDPWVFVRLNCVLRALAQSFAMLGIDRDIPEGERSVRLIEQTIRLHTHAVRNAGFADQVMAQLRAVFERLDTDHYEREGIRLSPLVTMWQGLMKMLEGRVSAHADGLYDVLSISDPERRIERYCKWRGYNTDAVGQMTAAWREAGGEADRAAAICINDADLLLPQLYVFDLLDFLKAFPESVNEDALLNTLIHWSYSPQDLIGKSAITCFSTIRFGIGRFYAWESAASIGQFLRFFTVLVSKCWNRL
jgi:hypothetical protein